MPPLSEVFYEISICWEELPAKERIAFLNVREGGEVVVT